MKKLKIRYILCGILAVILVYICYLFLHSPGVPVNVWTPDENFSVQDWQQTSIDPGALQFIDISPYKNPETVQIYDGWIYAAVDGGSIIRLKEGGSVPEQVLYTGGSILGFDFDAEGNLYFCDCNYKGAPIIGRFDGKTIESLPVRNLTYPDALCIDENNELLYFSNATCVNPADISCSPQDAYTIDMMAHTNMGSIVSFNLYTGEQQLVVDGLSFANGIQLAENGRCLLINETSENHIWRVDLATGQKKILLTIPGYPDNLHSADNGYWTGFAGIYAPAYAGLADKPLIRKAMTNLPLSLLSYLSGNASGTDVVFIKYDATGTVMEYNIIHDMNFTTTGAVETDQRVYLETIGNIDKIYYYEK